MRKEELWVVYITKNPAFIQAETITLTATGLKKLFDQTYQIGYDQGLSIGRSEKSVFEEMFGKTSQHL